MDRRALLTLTGATAIAAAAKPLSAAADDAWPIELRGRDGILRRLPDLDLDSNQAFLTEVRTWAQTAPQGLSRMARARSLEVLQENGYARTDEIPTRKVAELMEGDPTLMSSARAWLATQQLTWAGVKQFFDADQDRYLSELRSAERKGPGVLEFSAATKIPDYAKHEIHIMPGGYVGDPLAGYVYHYGTNNFFLGHNAQDEIQHSVADVAPAPTDRKVRRILDLGCSCGQTTLALKRRFPDAEVWGVDIGGPMVHYAHMRANDLNMDVNYRHALAEDTGFPDGHFDMVVSFILLHEVPNHKNTEIMQEISRLLRSGGTYYPVDAFTSFDPPKDAYGRFRRWWDHRWNNEIWALEHMDYDLPGDLERAGMSVTRKGPKSALGGRPNLYATKRA